MGVDVVGAGIPTKSIHPLSTADQAQILETYGQLMRNIAGIQNSAAKKLENHRRDACKSLEIRVKEISAKIQNEQDKTGENQADFKEREIHLNENLSTMTRIA